MSAHPTKSEEVTFEPVMPAEEERTAVLLVLHDVIENFLRHPPQSSDPDLPVIA